MGVYRPRWQLDGFFAQVPNAWLRDSRLTPKAMWILANIASQPPDRLVSVSLLCRQSAASHDAIYSGLRELEDCGYLTRVQERVKGQRLGEVVYVLGDPALSDNPPVPEKPDAAENPRVEEASNDPALSGSQTALSENPIVALSDSATPKKKTSKNTTEDSSEPDGFEVFWDAYGYKMDRAAALRAWSKVVKKVSLDRILAGVKAYHAFIVAKGDKAPPMKHPATWLNGQCWLNDYGSLAAAKPARPKPPRPSESPDFVDDGLRPVLAW